MYYEFNVSHDGHHLFATAERSVTDMVKASDMYVLFKKKFPECDGYKITVTYWEHRGQQVPETLLLAQAK